MVGAPESVKEEKRERPWWGGGGMEPGRTLIFAQWAHNFRYCFAQRRCTSATCMQAEREAANRAALSLFPVCAYTCMCLCSCQCECECMCGGPITMGLWCEFLSIVGVCVQLYTSLYVNSAPVLVLVFVFAFVWKDFLVFWKGHGNTLTILLPLLLRSPFSHSFISPAILRHSFPFPFFHFFLAAPKRILLQLFTYLAIE